MIHLNKVLIVGNLTRDPTLRYTRTGTAVADFSIAMNRRFESREGERREEVTFVPINAFGPPAESIHEHVHQGDSILIEGRLRQEKWQDEQTKQNRSRLIVVVSTWGYAANKAKPETLPTDQEPDAPPLTEPPETQPQQPTDTPHGSPLPPETHRD